MKHLFVSLLLGTGAFYAGKTYNVTHTEGEWFNAINGISFVQQCVHESDMPANKAFICDSVLQSQKADIYRQVSTAIAADTTKTKKP